MGTLKAIDEHETRKKKTKFIDFSFIHNRVAQSIVLMCQKFKSCYFPLIFPFLMIKYPSDSNFSYLGEDLDMDQGTFVFTK